MPRTIWKGALSFGLVNIPTGLYPATSDKTVHFNQFEEGTSDRIRYKKVNERTGEEVANDRIVRGFDLGGGEYVILTDEELESAEPKKSRQIEISDFVDIGDIDPVYFRSSYYLAPEGDGADKAYALLRRAMEEAGKVAIATLVMRNKEYLVAIRPEGDALAMHTMYFPDEVRTPGKELPGLPEDGDVSDRELSMAQLLIESMESDWDPDALPRHPPREGRGSHRGEAAGPRDRHSGRPGAGPGRRPHGGPERQHQGCRRARWEDGLTPGRPGQEGPDPSGAPRPRRPPKPPSRPRRPRGPRPLPAARPPDHSRLSPRLTTLDLL